MAAAICISAGAQNSREVHFLPNPRGNGSYEDAIGKITTYVNRALINFNASFPEYSQPFMECMSKFQRADNVLLNIIFKIFNNNNSFSTEETTTLQRLIIAIQVDQAHDFADNRCNHLGQCFTASAHTDSTNILYQYI